MKIKVSEASGSILDWLVAKVEGYIDDCNSWLHEATLEEVREGSFRPSTDWSQGGPIIEREGIDLNYSNHEGTSGEVWDAACEANRVLGGPNPLIAAMRCYVVSELGEEVEVPDELIKKE